MTPDTLRLYKLIILYALSRTKQGLPNAFLCDFILGHGYTDFFSIQETLALLTEDSLIEEEATRKTTYYKITQKGSQMLEYFSSMLPKDTIRQIDEYLRDNKVDILEATTVHTDYSVTPSGDYLASALVQERGNTLFSLSFAVPSEEAARRACQKFKENQTEIYQCLLKKLGE